LSATSAENLAKTSSKTRFWAGFVQNKVLLAQNLLKPSLWRGFDNRSGEI